PKVGAIQQRSNLALRLTRSAVDRYLLIVLGVFLAVIGIVLFGVAFTPWASPFGLRVVLVAAAAVHGGCTYIIAREAIGRFRTLIALYGDRLSLVLPAHRGYVGSPAFNGDVPLAAIRAVETRTEAFRELGSTVTQQAYTLRVEGKDVFLGADRAFAVPFYGN